MQKHPYPDRPKHIQYTPKRMPMFYYVRVGLKNHVSQTAVFVTSYEKVLRQKTVSTKKRKTKKYHSL